MGQQATASSSGYSLEQKYDGDRLRVKKVDNGAPTYYLRSAALGGQIVAELNASGAMTRGFVYRGGELLAVQQNNQVSWVHEDPVAKSRRVTDNAGGAVVSTIELDPWGGETSRSSNEGFQPRRFTSYTRDGNASDDAMHRRYNRWHARFDQPDPYDGSYDLTNRQSFNRYSYVQNDPVNFVDPLGLDPDFGLGPPPPVPTLIPYGGTIVTNTSAPRPGGGGVGSMLGGDVNFVPEDGPPGSEGGELDGGAPQNPTPTPTPCPGSIPEAAARQILAVSAQVGIDPTLLSVTWRHESSFTSNPPPNPRYEGRGRNRHLVGWDVGPMQTATNVWGKSPFTDGLSDPFGTISMNLSTRQYEGFNGNVSDNLTLGARAFSMDILDRSRSLADAAGLYRAGSRTGPGYQQRFNEYTREAPGDRAQLNCLANRP